MYAIVISILKKKKYLIIALVTGALMSALLYYLTVINIYKYSIFKFISMSGELFAYSSLFLSFLTSALFGIYLALLIFKKDITKKVDKKTGTVVGFGSAVGVVATGCPSCGIPLLGFIGFSPIAFMAFPLDGLEVKIFGVTLLAVSIYLVLKAIKQNLYCKVS